MLDTPNPDAARPVPAQIPRTDIPRLSAGKKLLFLAGLLLCALAVAEIAAHCVYRVQNGRFIWRGVQGEGMGVFQPHPYLAGVPRPGARGFAFDGQVEINAQGYRGPPLRDGAAKILCLGGSTTFCVGVSTGETWPEQLQKELSGLPSGPVDVVNSGVPGYSSAENVIQLALRDYALNPGIVILFQGLNDLRSSHAPDLTPDYAWSHGDHQAKTLDVAWRDGASIIALRYYALQALRKISPPQPQDPVVHSEPDLQLAEIFRSNLRSIAALTRKSGARLLLVPQVLWEPLIALKDRDGWIPFVDPKSVMVQMSALNDVMREVAREENASFAQSVLDYPWTVEDFAGDYCHFSARGCIHMAQLLAAHLKAEGLTQALRPRG